MKPPSQLSPFFLSDAIHKVRNRHQRRHTALQRVHHVDGEDVRAVVADQHSPLRTETGDGDGRRHHRPQTAEEHRRQNPRHHRPGGDAAQLRPVPAQHESADPDAPHPRRQTGLPRQQPDHDSRSQPGVQWDEASEAVQLHQEPMSEVVLRLLRQRRVLLHVQLHELLQQPGERGPPAEGDQDVSGEEPERLQAEDRQGEGRDGGQLGQEAHERVQLQEVRLSEELLRVLRGEDRVFEQLQMRGVPEHRGFDGEEGLEEHDRRRLPSADAREDGAGEGRGAVQAEEDVEQQTGHQLHHGRRDRGHLPVHAHHLRQRRGDHARRGTHQESDHTGVRQVSQRDHRLLDAAQLMTTVRGFVSKVNLRCRVINFIC
jgi:hypothetical protein